MRRHNTMLLMPALLLLSSCGSNPCDRDILVDPRLEIYALDFENYMGIKTSCIDMEFKDLEDRAMGLCTMWTNEVGGKIEIDGEVWNGLNDEGREELMFHELGHCAMKLDHDSAMVIDPFNNYTIEASIMNPFFFGDKYNWHRYKPQYKLALKNNTHIIF